MLNLFFPHFPEDQIFFPFSCLQVLLPHYYLKLIEIPKFLGEFSELSISLW